MFRRLSLFLIPLFWIGVSTAHAQTSARAEREAITVMELRAAIADGQVATVETALSRAQQDFIRGDISAGAMRALFTVFETNNPEISSFAARWQRMHPKSASANAALTWALDKTSWDIRGPGFARDIYPDALTEFHFLQRQAKHYARIAYDLDPRLIPASDAMIAVANTTGDKQGGFAVLEAVMKTDPNNGTLSRAMFLTNPGWGGTWPMAERLCELYAPVAGRTVDDPVKSCKVEIAASYHLSTKLDWVRAELATGAFPELDYQRIKIVIDERPTEDTAAFAYDYLTREGITNYEYAGKFDRNMAWKFGYDYLSETHSLRAKAQAREAIKDDPYDMELLKVLERDVVRVSDHQDLWKSSVVQRVSQEEKAEYARRKLLASPYDPDLWLAYGRYRHKSGWTPETFLKNEPMRINAIVYSNHSPRYLFSYVYDKWKMLAALERLDTDPERPEWQAASPEQQAEAEVQRQAWLARRAWIDHDVELICPMMRAYRLYGALCGAPGSSNCEMSPQLREMFEIVRSDVNDRGACQGVMASPVDGLLFSPIPVDLSGTKG